ncbi:hypothetical protein TIFTF001_016898 [Ficus carica]|uniref:Uncharacterized protein n=1 Tax=Ficus carica TaxID=3494 RepID=A0AA88AB75_FICCA|nr:hypothetical protein TIFTF001_016898 [Ficus carica]
MRFRSPHLVESSPWNADYLFLSGNATIVDLRLQITSSLLTVQELVINFPDYHILTNNARVGDSLTRRQPHFISSLLNHDQSKELWFTAEDGLQHIEIFAS